ncbi:hypothetical protein DFS34DRAFT_582993 [Phlyctochytrium arcticum]|nr:hypothetical protein DFS34DRAFT_582993 [Phlyctochytrium arcticum]
MRVAFVHPDLGIGGAERLVVDAAAGLKAKGHQVVMYTSHHDPTHCFEETIDGTLTVRVHGDWLPRHLFSRGHVLFAILRALFLTIHMFFHRQEHDVLFVDQISAAVPLLKLTGLPILFYCHFPDKLLTQRWSLLKKIYRAPFDYLEERTTQMADKVVVNSRFTAGVFHDSFPSIREIPEVLYPGIVLQAYNQPVDYSNKRVSSLVSDKTTILSINRFERKKNIGLAVRAFALLREELSPVKFATLRLVIAGGYDSRVRENVEHLEELDNLTKSLGLLTYTFREQSDSPSPSHQVIFLPSFTEAQRSYLLSSALCLVYTPSDEHFGIVPIEAMYGGLPVVAVNRGGPTETIVHGKTGFLCNPEPREFSTALLQLVNDPRCKEKYSEASRKRVEEHFSAAAFIKNLETILSRIIAEHKSQANSWMIFFIVFVLASGLFLSYNVVMHPTLH